MVSESSNAPDANSDDLPTDAFAAYTVDKQRRIYQRGARKGQRYTYYKFRDKKTGRIVKNAKVLKAAKMEFIKQPYKRGDILKGQPSVKTIAVTKLLIKGYIRRKDSEWGEIGSEAGDFVHYKVESSSKIHNEYEAFLQKIDMGGYSPHYSMTHSDGEPLYGNAEVEVIETKFYHGVEWRNISEK